MLFLNILTQSLSPYNVIPKHSHTIRTMLFLKILTQSLSPHNVIPKHSHTILVPLQCYS
jgi:hypothetical protein